MKKLSRLLQASSRITRLRGVRVYSKFLARSKRKLHVTHKAANLFRTRPFFLHAGGVPDHLFELTSSFSVPHSSDNTKQHHYKSILCKVDRISGSPRLKLEQDIHTNHVIIDRLHTIYSDYFKGEATQFGNFKSLFDRESTSVEIIWDCEKEAENTVGFILYNVKKTKFNGRDIILCKQGHACVDDWWSGVIPFMMYRFLYKLQMEHLKDNIPCYGFYTAIYPLNFYILPSTIPNYIPRSHRDERITNEGAGLMSHAIKTFYGIDHPEADILKGKLAIKRYLRVKEDLMRIKISYLEKLIKTGEIDHFDRFFKYIRNVRSGAYLDGYGVPMLFPTNQENLLNYSRLYNKKFNIALKEGEHPTDPFVRKVYDIVDPRYREKDMHAEETEKLDLYSKLWDLEFEKLWRRVTTTESNQRDWGSSRSCP